MPELGSDPRRRRQYLKALGVDIYVRRGPSTVEAAEAAEVATMPEPVAVAELRPRAAPVSRAEAPLPGPEPASREFVAPAVAPTPAVQVPTDWTGLRDMVRDCSRCKLCATRTQTVFGVGLESAPLMVVGEGPGADEDARGEPFVGRAGQLLDQMLAAIGQSRDQNTYIANVVKCRPPGNRDPEADEVEACRPYLDRQIELVKPRLIVALGRIAAQRLLQSDAPLSRLRGPLYQYGAGRTPVLVTYHPAYLLRSPREKSKSWDDLKRVHQLLRQPA